MEDLQWISLLSSLPKVGPEGRKVETCFTAIL